MHALTAASSAPHAQLHQMARTPPNGANITPRPAASSGSFTSGSFTSHAHHSAWARCCRPPHPESPSFPTYEAVHWAPAAPYLFQHPRPPRPVSMRIYEAHVGMSSEEGKVNTSAPSPPLPSPLPPSPPPSPLETAHLRLFILILTLKKISLARQLPGVCPARAAPHQGGGLHRRAAHGGNAPRKIQPGFGLSWFDLV